MTMTNRMLSDEGRQMIKSGMKLYLNAYIGENKTPSIGYGITRYPDGVLNTHGGNVKIGDRISKIDADTLFDSQMMLFEECVNNFIRVPITQNQFDAMVYFCYKMGIENFLMHPGLAMLNSFQYREAIEEFKKNPKANSEKSTKSAEDSSIMESIYEVFLS